MTDLEWRNVSSVKRSSGSVRQTHVGRQDRVFRWGVRVDSQNREDREWVVRDRCHRTRDRWRTPTTVHLRPPVGLLTSVPVSRSPVRTRRCPSITPVFLGKESLRHVGVSRVWRESHSSFHTEEGKVRTSTFTFSNNRLFRCSSHKQKERYRKRIKCSTVRVRIQGLSVWGINREILTWES